MILPNADIDMGVWWHILLIGITTEELVWVLKAKAGDFIAGMKGAKAAQDDAAESTGRASRKWKAFAGLLAGLVVTAVAAVAAIIGKMSFEMANNAAKQRQLIQSFHNLARAAGESGNAILRAMREGLGGAASQIDILLEANRALVSGLPASAAKMGELTRVARGMAKIMGIDVTEALQRMVKGIAKQEIELLDELFGGSIKFIDILRELGPTASAAEKQLAIYNAVVAAGKERVDRANLSMEGYDTTIEKVTANLVNLKLAVGDKLVPLFESLAQKIGNAAEKLKDFLSDETVSRLRELGQDDLADAAAAQLSVDDLEARRGRLRVQAQHQRLATGRSAFTGGRLESVNAADVQRALKTVTDQEVAAINARIAAERKLQEEKNKGFIGTTKEQMAAEAALELAKEKEGVLAGEHQRLNDLLNTLQEIAGLDAQILKMRQEAANIGLALPEITVTGKKYTPLSPGQNILRQLAGANLDTTPGVRDDAMHQKVEISLDPQKQNEFERNMAATADRGAKKAQDAMTRFTKGVPSDFERNMQRAFANVQSIASQFGLRTQGILGGAFNFATGLEGLANFRTSTADTKLLRTVENVAGILGPLGSAIGGAIGVFRGVKSLFSRPSEAHSPQRAAGTSYELSQPGIERKIADIDAQLATYTSTYTDPVTGETVYEDPETGEILTGRVQALQAERARYQADLGRASGTDRQRTGDVTYSSHVTLTENTGKNILSQVSTSAAYLSNIESATMGSRALLEEIRDILNRRGSGFGEVTDNLSGSSSYVNLRSRLRARGLDTG